MDIMKIDAMLAQLKTGAALAAGKPVTITAAIGMHKNEGEPAGVDFSTIIKKSLDEVSHAQGRAAGLARDFEVGAPNANLTEAMIAMQKASLSFQYTVQVRNKLVSAYQEIMNMPV